jgi:hypothetical protein
VLVVEFALQGPDNKAVLSEDATFDEKVDIIGPADCLKAGATITAGVPCRVYVSLPTARSTVGVILISDRGSAEAWLPARLRFVEETKPYPVAEGQKIGKEGRGMNRPSGSITLTAEQIAEGWLFDPATANARIDQIYLRRGNCDEVSLKPTGYEFVYSFRVYAKDGGGGGDGWANCWLIPSIMMKRSYWRGEGELAN